MKHATYEKEKVKIVRELGITDKQGTWVQIEFLSGSRKGSRIPAAKEMLDL